MLKLIEINSTHDSSTMSPTETETLSPSTSTEATSSAKSITPTKSSKPNKLTKAVSLEDRTYTRDFTKFQLDCIKKGLMNPPHKSRATYTPSEIEHCADCCTHGVCIIPALFGMYQLIQRSRTQLHYHMAVVYGLALVGLFTFSTLYHVLVSIPKYRHSRMVHLVHMADHFMIYIFIASSYMPWMTLQGELPYSTLFQCLMWCVAVGGIVYSTVCHQQNAVIETLLYVALGCLPAVPLVVYTNTSMWECVVGGLSYLVGIFFFASDGRIPMAHAIWHMHVSVGASIHYYAVWTYLYS